MRIADGGWALLAGTLTIGCAGAGGPQTTAINTLGEGDGTETTSGPGEGTTVGDSGEATSVADSTVSSTGADGVDSTGATDDGPPADCDEDPAACTAWILPAGSGSWTAEALDAGSPLAPSGTVQAAFDVEEELEGFVLTESNLHVVDLAGRQWVRVISRGDAVPEIGDDEIRVAYSIPAYWGASGGGDPNLESIAFVSATTIYLYDYEIDTQGLVFGSATTSFGMAWDAPAAPARDQMRSTWLDVTNDPGWATGDLMAQCDAMGEIGPHSPVVAADQVHVFDAGYCFEFLDPVPYASFEPFGLPGAPVVDDVGASLYSETMGLWVFRGS